MCVVFEKRETDREISYLYILSCLYFEYVKAHLNYAAAVMLAPVAPFTARRPGNSPCARLAPHTWTVFVVKGKSFSIAHLYPLTHLCFRDSRVFALGNIQEEQLSLFKGCDDIRYRTRLIKSKMALMLVPWFSVKTFDALWCNATSRRSASKTGEPDEPGRVSTSYRTSPVRVGWGCVGMCVCVCMCVFVCI